jgi:hypothetical protein
MTTVSESLGNALEGVRRRFVKRRESKPESLSVWLEAHPEAAEESKEGFADLRADRLRRVSRPRYL